MTARANDPHVGLVVEGAGDSPSLPVLLRKHLEESARYQDVLGKPIPIHGRGNATVTRGIEGFVATAGYRPGCVGVLVVLDGDDDCVAELGPSLLERAVPAVPVPVRIALAERDFEDWLYSSAETLGLDLDHNPAQRGLGAIMGALRPNKYVKPTWQPRLAGRTDLSIARPRSRSLSRMLDKFDELFALLPQDDE